MSPTRGEFVRASRARGKRPARFVLVAIGLAVAGGFVAADLDLRDLAPSSGGWNLFVRFAACALIPAVDYEAADVPPDTPAFLVKVVLALVATLTFAAAASGVSLLVAIPLGGLGSTVWRDGLRARAEFSVRSPKQRRWADRMARVLRWATWLVARGIITILRAVHEIVWAVIFLAALGLTPTAAVLAIALPFTGTLAKVISELLDEAPLDAARLLGSIGASPLRGILIGVVPRALPDVLAYALYRFECAVRSAAVLGFFGLPTLGYYLELSFANGHYREAWTQLWALIGGIVIIDLWSSAIRRRLVAG
jgi:phosphonate transport system permease protein